MKQAKRNEQATQTDTFYKNKMQSMNNDAAAAACAIFVLFAFMCPTEYALKFLFLSSFVCLLSLKILTNVKKFCA